MITPSSTVSFDYQLSILLPGQLAMATLQPRGPYSQEELEKLYPKNLELQLVQIVSLFLNFYYLFTQENLLILLSFS